MDQVSPSKGPPPPDVGAWPHVLGSLAAHLALLAISAVLMPSLGEVTLDAEAERPSYLSPPFLTTLADHDGPEEPDLAPVAYAPRDPDEQEPAESRCGEEHGGSMGNPSAAVAAFRYGVRGPVDNPDPHVGHSARSGQISFAPVLFNHPEASWGGETDAPTAPWGRDDSLGNDPVSARGHMWAEETGKAFGSPGLGMGLSVLCETCGASGRGAGLRGTAPDGETGTEPSFRVAQAPSLRR